MPAQAYFPGWFGPCPVRSNAYNCICTLWPRAESKERGMLSLEMANFCMEGNCPGARCFGFAARASEEGIDWEAPAAAAHCPARCAGTAQGNRLFSLGM